MTEWYALSVLAFGLLVGSRGELCDEFRSELQAFRHLLVQHNETIARQVEEMEAMKQELAVLKGHGHSMGRRQTEGVAFTAYHNHEEHVHAGNALKFSSALYNIGGLYDPSTGIATIQVPGTYLFTVTIEHWTTVELRCYLVVDGVNQVDVIIYPQGRSTQASNTAILGLQQGQKVWVKTDEGTVYGSDGFRGTTFAGVMLF